MFTATIYTSTTSAALDIDWAADQDDAYDIASRMVDILGLQGDLLWISVVPQD